MEKESSNDVYIELSRQRARRSKIEVLLRAYSWGGVLMAIVGGGYFLSTLIEFDLSVQQQFSLMIAGSGIALTIMAKVMVNLRKAQFAKELEQIDEIDTLHEFMEIWSKFENTARTALESAGNDDNIHSLRSMISFLQSDSRIDESDKKMLQEALKMRNLIAHGRYPSSEHVSERISTGLIEITNKIRESTETQSAMN